MKCHIQTPYSFDILILERAVTSNSTNEADNVKAADQTEPQAEVEQTEVETDESSVETSVEQSKATTSDDEKGVAEALEAAQEKIRSLQDQMLRDKAETQNVRRRVQKDVENARKFALDKFVAELLPVIDNLERALDSAESYESVKEGIQLTLKNF